MEFDKETCKGETENVAKEIQKQTTLTKET